MSEFESSSSGSVVTTTRGLCGSATTALLPRPLVGSDEPAQTAKAKKRTGSVKWRNEKCGRVATRGVATTWTFLNLRVELMGLAGRLTDAPHCHWAENS